MGESGDGFGGQFDDAEVLRGHAGGILARGAARGLRGEAVVAQVVAETRYPVSGVAHIGVDERHDGQDSAYVERKILWFR